MITTVPTLTPAPSRPPRGRLAPRPRVPMYFVATSIDFEIVYDGPFYSREQAAREAGVPVYCHGSRCRTAVVYFRRDGILEITPID